MELDNFCYMPWHGMAIAANGNIKPCCQWSGSLGKIESVNIADSYINNKKIKELRQSFLNNEKDNGCKSCWTREEQIGKSRRTWFKDKFINKEIFNNYVSNIENFQLKQIDINLSNICNLKCRMCGSWASNSWFEEDLILSKINPKFEKESNIENLKIRQHTINDLKSLIPYFKNLERIDFKGGEPMLAENHVKFLELLIKEKLNNKIILQYTTNGTVINKNILNCLSKFKQVRIIFSIEGTGKLYSYIRGGNYTIEDLEKNVSQYNNLNNVHIGFNVTIQAYNLLNLLDLYNLLHNWQDKYVSVSAEKSFTTICNSPMYLSPFVLPLDLRKKAKKKIKNIPDFESLENNLLNNHIHNQHWETFKFFTLTLDKLRKENIKNIVPSIGDYFN